MRLEGWESFWSCCADPGSLGFNGVTTWCRAGLAIAADAAPLGEPRLDMLGRCVKVELAKFIVFNVYAPQSGNPGGVSLQMQFLESLRRAAIRAHAETQKHIIICGDLNANYDARDIHWSRRRVRIDRVIKLASEEKCATWKSQVSEWWPKIEASIEKQRVIEVVTRNPHTKQAYQKYRLEMPSVTEEADKWCKVGSPEYSKNEVMISIEGVVHETLGEIYPKRCVSVATLTELMRVLAGIAWNASAQQLVADEVGECPRSIVSIDWMERMLGKGTQSEGDLVFVDTFREMHSDSQHSFTCWAQHNNSRFRNEGSRIDYFLVDRGMLERKAILRVDPGSSFDSKQRYECGGAEALRVTTANGHFQPARGDGTGLCAASLKGKNTQFHTIKHSGICYTPPTYSDHAAVTLIVDDDMLSGPPSRSCKLASSSVRKGPSRTKHSVQ